MSRAEPEFEEEAVEADGRTRQDPIDANDSHGETSWKTLDVSIYV